MQNCERVTETVTRYKMHYSISIALCQNFLSRNPRFGVNGGLYGQSLFPYVLFPLSNGFPSVQFLIKLDTTPLLVTLHSSLRMLRPTQ